MAMSKLMETLRTVGTKGLVSSMRDYRADAFANQVTGFGTDRDKTMFGYWSADPVLTDTYLSNLYHGNSTAARMVDAVPQYELQKGFTVDVGDEALNKRINAKLRSLNALESLREARSWGRLFGGAAILLGCDDGRPSESPLMPERARNLDWLFALDKRYLWPMTYYTELGENFGKPETYMFSPMSPRGSVYKTVIHESRLILFPGDDTARLERDANLGWDQSVLQRAHEVLRSHDVSWKALEIMLTEAQQAVFSMSGLAAVIASGEETLLKDRMKLVDMMRSVVRAMVIDADGKEKFERQFATFTGVAEAMDKIMLRLAAAMKMPVTILMGQSPAGMNATGVSDLSNWYNWIESCQTTVQAQRIRRIVEVWCATQEGPNLKPSEIEEESVVQVKWPSLWTESPLENAQRRSAIAMADVAAVGAGIYTPEEVALQRSSENWDGQIQLSEMGREAREQSLTDEFTKILEPPENSTEATQGIELAPTDIAKAITLNEARASQGLPPSKGPDGDKPLAEIGEPAGGGGFGQQQFDAADDQPRDDPIQ